MAGRGFLFLWAWEGCSAPRWASTDTVAGGAFSLLGGESPDLRWAPVDAPEGSTEAACFFQ